MLLKSVSFSSTVCPVLGQHRIVWKSDQRFTTFWEVQDPSWFYFTHFVHFKFWIEIALFWNGIHTLGKRDLSWWHTRTWNHWGGQSELYSSVLWAFEHEAASTEKYSRGYHITEMWLMTEKHTPSGLLHEPKFVCRNKIFHLQCTRFGTLVPRRHLCWEMSVWTLPEAFCRLVFCVCVLVLFCFVFVVCLFVFCQNNWEACLGGEDC